MKKIITAFLACVALTQSAYAATSPLVESLLEYEAITNALGSDPIFQNVIPQNEFIVDIKRLTKEINVPGRIKYAIVTQYLVLEEDSCGSAHRHRESNRYIATVNVTPNPGIGPNIITVLSIVEAPNN